MKKLIRFLPILTAALAILTAAALIIQTLDIYLTADGQMYTTEIISGHFRPIALLPVLLLLCIIASVFLPKDSNKEKPVRFKDSAGLPDISIRKKISIRLLLIISGLLLIIAGIMNGGMFDVFVKAINICTECIGLG